MECIDEPIALHLHLPVGLPCGRSFTLDAVPEVGAECIRIGAAEGHLRAPGFAPMEIDLLGTDHLDRYEESRAEMLTCFIECQNLREVDPCGESSGIDREVETGPGHQKVEECGFRHRLTST